MGNPKRSLSKKLKIIVPIVTISGILLIILNALFGNPVSAMLAKKAMNQYIEQDYSFLDLKLEKVNYNFKFAEYSAMAQSTTSEDTRFTIYYKDGQRERDDYQTRVLGMANTLDRLSREYSLHATNIITEELGLKDSVASVFYKKDDYFKNRELLELDMAFDRSLPINAIVRIELKHQDNSLEHIAKVIAEAHQAFIENGCYFSNYGLFIQNEDVLVMVSNVLPVHIESGELVKLIEDSKKNQGMNGIYVWRNEIKD